MRIGIDIRVLMDKYYSGVSEYSANLLEALLKQDTTNQYKLFYNSWRSQGERFSIWQRANTLMKFSRFSNKLFNYCLQKIFKYPKLDKFIGGSDVFWLPHFNFASLSPNTKKVITVHDLSFLRYPEFFSGRKNFWHKALAIKKTLDSADKIVAVSQNTKNDLVELLNIQEEKIALIYSGNNLEHITVETRAKEEFKRKHKLRNRFILYLGNIEPRKNICGLIAAYNKLRSQNADYSDIQLVLAGASGWKTKKIYTAFKNSPYKKDIIFLGYVDKEEKRILYQSASLLAYPSFYEGFGFPPLEAMAAGLPIVCSNNSSLPEVSGDAALLINPFKTEEITMAMQLVLDDKELAALLVNKGLKRAQEFTWEKTALAYLNLFEEISKK